MSLCVSAPLIRMLLKVNRANAPFGCTIIIHEEMIG
jgi:hypothetical protein